MSSNDILRIYKPRTYLNDVAINSAFHIAFGGSNVSFAVLHSLTVTYIYQNPTEKLRRSPEIRVSTCWSYEVTRTDTPIVHRRELQKDTSNSIPYSRASPHFWKDKHIRPLDSWRHSHTSETCLLPRQRRQGGAYGRVLGGMSLCTYRVVIPSCSSTSSL